MRGGRTVAGNNPEGVAMQVDRVVPGRGVGHGEDVTAALPQGQHRVHDVTLGGDTVDEPDLARSEEHTSELQSLMRISYAVFCLKKKNKKHNTIKRKIKTT